MRRPVYESGKYGDGVWRLRWLPGRSDYYHIWTYNPRFYSPRRLRWLPGRSDTLLVAGMRSGVHIVDVDRRATGSAGEAGSSGGGGWGSMAQVGLYREHEARCEQPAGVESFLAYGADWCHAEGEAEGGRLGASVSFYDHSLHVWRASPLETEPAP